MGKPITWQNVNGPSLSDAAAPMAAAQRSFDTAFSRLGDELVRRQTTQDANYAQGKVNNTEAFLSQISQYRTPEELQAAQESGVFDALRQRFGAQVDQAAVRQAQDLRPGVLQERVLRENQFNDAQLDRAQASTRDAIMAAVNRGDILTANVLMSGAPNLRNVAALEAASAQAQKGFVNDARAATTHSNQQQLFPGQLAAQKAAADAAAAQLKLTQAQTAALEAKTGAESKNTAVQRLLLGHNQGYNADIAAWNQKAKQIGAEMKLPVDPTTGMPDLKALNPETLKAFQAKLGPTPSSSERLAVFNKQMNDAGVDLATQATAREMFNKSFGTGVDISATDAKQLERQGKLIDDSIAARRKSNILISGSEEERQKETEATQAYFESQFKDGEFFTKGRHREAINKIMAEGLTLNTPKGSVTYPIPPKLMKLALSSVMERDTVAWNNTKENVTDFLSKYVKSPEYAKQLREFDELAADPTGAVAKKKLIDSFTRPEMGVSPNAFSNRLNAAIEAADARASSAAATAANSVAPVTKVNPPAVPRPVSAGPEGRPANVSSFEANRAQRAAIEELKKNSIISPGASTVVPPAQGSNAAPAVIATPVPKGHTVGASADLVIGPKGATTSKPDPALDVPPDTKWGAPKTVVEASAPGGREAVVTFVPDADGLVMKLGDGKSLSCRLHSIDAPEVKHDARVVNGKKIKASPDQAQGPEARDYLSQLVLDKKVTVVVTQSAETSKQKRNFCQVSFKGEDVSLKVLEAGFAKVYDRFVVPELADKAYSAQLRAKEARRGIWKDLFPQSGEDFRRSND